MIATEYGIAEWSSVTDDLVISAPSVTSTSAILITPENKTHIFNIGELVSVSSREPGTGFTLYTHGGVDEEPFFVNWLVIN